MQIHLSEVLSQNGAVRNYEAALEFNEVTFLGTTYPVLSKNPVSLTIRHGKEKKLAFTFDVSLVLQMACDRCLKEVDVPFDFTGEAEVDMGQTAEERIQDLEEAAYIDEYTLDVDKLVEEELYMHMPMKVLCREDCPGIPGAASDSDSEAGMSEEAGLDPRMAVIRDLFQNTNESDKEV